MQAWFGDLVDRLVALEPQAWLVLVVVVLLLVGFGYLGNWIVGSMLRAGLSAEFGLTDVPHGIRIRLGYRVPEGEMTLSFPRWLYPNRDGTRDRRRSRNALIRDWSTLALGRYRVRSRNPFRGYELCRQAREAGHCVAWTLEEQDKGRSSERRQRLLGDLRSAAQIAARFAGNPTGFEHYCAGLFRSSGYLAQVTSKTRDGGYDLVLERGGVHYIAECKCYTTTTVGRPDLQKLVGANVTARGQGMIFVTTSDYSSDAREYAGQAGIELIDGRQLTLLARQVGGSADPSQPVLGAMLTNRDLWQYYPADVRPANARS